jgi:hypothetical protein
MVTFSDFIDHFGDLDWVGILVGTAALMVLGFLWYGPIFGKPWSKAMGVEMNGSAAGMGMPLILTAIYLFVFNVGIAFVAPFDDIEHALVWGIIIGVLLIAPVLYSPVVWAKQKYVVFLIGVTHWFLAAAIATYVQGLFL